MSTLTLHDVCVNGNTTTLAINTGGLTSEKSIQLGYGTPEGNYSIFFRNEGDDQGVFLTWQNNRQRFRFNKNVEFDEALFVTDKIFTRFVVLNGESEDVSPYIKFNKSGTGYEKLEMDKDTGEFCFSNDVQISGNINVASAVVCDKLEFLQTLPIGSVRPNSYLTITCNGFDYKIPAEKILVPRTGGLSKGVKL